LGGQRLNSITAGPDLAPLQRSGQGQTSAKDVAGRPGKIGQVFRSGQTNYVLTGTGLVGIGTVMAALLAANGTAPTDISAGEAGQALSGDKKVEPDGFPSTRPPLRSVTSPQVCAALQPASAGRQPLT